jgi:ATP synthase protein I
MSRTLAGRYRKTAYKGVLLQGCCAIIIAIIIFIGWGFTAGISALAGGFVSVVPNFVFAMYAFRYVGASKSELVYVSLKRGNALKFLLTICFFALVFKYFTVMAMPFFICYILVVFSQWYAHIFFNH